ncbi:MAG: Gfo/Idh/MocA family oxidoreductase [SAR324 cluster bacterium]|nr:Gfo/Idh/MocA family oxidoreductase [SAR324 cluster bacterium]
MPEKVKVGMIGCGNISQAYLDASKNFEVFEFYACTDLNMDLARIRADENQIKALSFEELIDHPDIKIVLNITPPRSHAEISQQILNAGKHVYSEKPLATTCEEGKKLLDLAKEKGLRVGCAPDTSLGGGLQTIKKLIHDGWIGKAISGTAHMMSRGPESWHPNPGFFYEKGGGPMFDMGPYYLTTLVSLLGPVQSLTAITKTTFDQRTATCEAQFGQVIPVETPTHYTGVLQFHSGALVTMMMSFDVCAHGHPPIEIYGTEGSLQVPDPNFFHGPVRFRRSRKEEWQEVPLTHGYTENLRSIGIADMAHALGSGREHRCNGEVAYHVLDVMHAFEKSSNSGKHVNIDSRCQSPTPLPLGLIHGRLDA